MELSVIAAPFSGPVNDVRICRDLRSATGAEYVLVIIHDRECEKKLLNVLVKSKDPSAFSFARNNEMIYGFPRREPRRFSAFAPLQSLTGYQREQTSLSLVMTCIASELPFPLLYLVLTQDCISITRENEIYFTPPADLSQLDPETDETACTVCCAEMVRELLSPEPAEPVFAEQFPAQGKRRRSLFRRKAEPEESVSAGDGEQHQTARRGLFRRRDAAEETGETKQERRRRRREEAKARSAEKAAEKKRRRKNRRKKPLRSCELIEKKCRSRSYSSLAELYRDIQLTALPEKKPTLGQRIRGFWVRNRDRIFHILLVVCTIALIVTVIMLISQILFGDIPLLRLFRHCFDTIGTEKLNIK